MKKHFVTLAMLVIMMSVTAQTTYHAILIIDGINYMQTSDNTVEVTSGGTYTGSIVIPSTVAYSGTTFHVTAIGYQAFSYCSDLISITIPSSVTSIRITDFNDCISLVNYIVDNNNPTYTSLDGVLFNKARTTLIAYPNGKPTSHYVIPSSVTSIGINAFLIVQP